MTEELVEWYCIIKNIQCERKHLQRKNIFSKPVRGYSLESLAKNEQLERSQKFTDKSKYISDVDIIDDWVVDALSKKGYIKFSDIYLINKNRFKSSIDLPDNALDELYSMAIKYSEIDFEGDITICETIQREKAIDKLMSIQWHNIILFEYTILNWIKDETERLFSSKKINSKYELIQLFISDLNNPKNYAEAISFCTNTSENYVKNIISGRIEKGLSKKEREEILDRDNNKCKLCSKESNLEVHHVIPVANGGGKYSKNLCTLCSDCHFHVAHDKNTSTISYENQSEFWEEVIGESPPD